MRPRSSQSLGRIFCKGAAVGPYLPASISLLFSLFVSCSKPGATSPSEVGKLKIVTTVAMVTDIAREIAGDRARVQGLMGEGVDPHLYKATRDDVAKMLAADIIFYSGHMLEGKMTLALKEVGKRKPVYAVAEAIDPSLILRPDGPLGHPDPHVWMDAAAWSQSAQALAKALANREPSNTEFFERNTAALRGKMEELNDYAKKAFATVPKPQRVLITSHDAFQYFGRAYDLEVLGVQGLSTESEAGLKDIQARIDLIVSRGVRAVFVESSVPAKNVQALVEGVRARGHELKIGGSLFSDAMGNSGDYEGTYIGMIDHNVTTVVRALGGEAPERGFQGKLNPQKYGQHDH